MKIVSHQLQLCKKVAIVGLVVSMVWPFSVFAQTNTATSQATTFALPTTCNQIYPDIAVNASLSSPVTNLVTGIESEVTVSFSNKTRYPISNGVLYAQIYQLPNEAASPREGVVVDQFVAVRDFSLEPSGTSTASFIWQVPTWLSSGSYLIDTAVIANDTHTLLGSPVDVQTSGNTLRLTVSNDDKDKEAALLLQSDQVAVNGQTVVRSSSFPLIDKQDTARITVPVVNQTNTQQSFQLTFKQYAYNQVVAENFVSELEKSLTLDAGERLVIEEEFTAEGHGEYVIVAELRTPLGETYFTNIPFTVSDVTDPYIRFLALDEERSSDTPFLYACLDQFGGIAANENLTLDVVLETAQQRRSLIEKKPIALGIDPILEVIPIPDTRFTRATATISLSANERVVTEQQFPITCRGGSCLVGNDSTVGPDGSNQSINSLFYLIGVSLAVVVLLALILSAPLLRRLFRNTKPDHENQS